MDIRLVKLNELDKLLDAIKRLWNPNHVYCRNPELFKYLIFNTPYRKSYTGNDEDTSCFAIFDEGKIVGFEGIIPLEGNIFGKTVTASTATLLKVDKQHNLAGLDLLQKSFEKDPNLHVAIGINHRVAKLYAVLGRYIFNDLPRWIWTEHFNEVKKVFNIPDNTNLNFLNNKVCCENILSEGLYENFLKQDKWDEFYNNEFSKKTIGFKKDYKFLKWRYLDYPFFNYKLLSVKDESGNYKGLAIYRIESILDGKYKIGRILEFIYTDIDYGMNLAEKLKSIDEDILFWDFYCLSSITAIALEHCGFIRLDSAENKKYIPTRFQPIDYEIMNIMGSVRLNDSVKKQLNLVTDQQWYITRGDADQDRPN